jgi:hypothetical protein
MKKSESVVKRDSFGVYKERELTSEDRALVRDSVFATLTALDSGKGLPLYALQKLLGLSTRELGMALCNAETLLCRKYGITFYQKGEFLYKRTDLENAEYVRKGLRKAVDVLSKRIHVSGHIDRTEFTDVQRHSLDSADRKNEAARTQLRKTMRAKDPVTVEIQGCTVPSGSTKI